VWVAGSPQYSGRFRDRITRRFLAYITYVIFISILATVLFQWISTFTEWLPFLFLSKYPHQDHGLQVVDMS
jgi:polyferredoxin